MAMSMVLMARQDHVTGGAASHCGRWREPRTAVDGGGTRLAGGGDPQRRRSVAWRGRGLGWSSAGLQPAELRRWRGVVLEFVAVAMTMAINK